MSDETMRRLRALDPEREGADAPPIGPLLERIAAEQTSSRRRTRPAGRVHRRRHPIAVAVALACLAAVAVAALVLGGSADPRRDALVPAGDGAVIVHVVSRTTIVSGKHGRRVGVTMQDGHGGTVGTMDGPVERWSATDPMRWRTLTTLLPGSGGPGGTMEQSFADDVLLTRDSWREDVRRQRGGMAALSVPGGGFMGGAPGAHAEQLMAGVADPRKAVRAMVDDGEARRAGSVVRQGRRLLRLVAVRRAVRDGRSRSIRPASRAVYLVDGETHAPVEVVTQLDLAARRAGPPRYGTRQRTVFDVYENIPLNSQTARLLQLGGGADPAPAAGSDAIVHTRLRGFAVDRAGRRMPLSFQGGGMTLSGSIDRWSADGSTRWRELTGPPQGIDGRVYEQSFADGVQRTERSWGETYDDDLMRGTGSPQRGLGLALRTLTNGLLTAGRLPAGAPLRDSGLALVGGVLDPRATVRAMVARGEVRADGETTRAGRRLLRFTGSTKSERSGRGTLPATRTVYLLDAETYAPVEVSIVSSHTARDQHGRAMPMRDAKVLLFDVYETVPLDDDSASLLTLGGPTG